MNVYAVAVLISVFVLFILITGLLVAYLRNKGFYKGFFYPEYRFFNKIKGFQDTSITHSTIFLLLIKLMKNYITFFDISASKDASNFYQYQASGASEEKFYTFLSLDTFSKPESGDNRKEAGTVEPSKKSICKK